MRIFLSGPMGSGKSTIGRLLGELLDLPVFDLDAAIEAEAGRRVTELFAERGEAAFRALEFATLSRMLDEGDHCVLSLGGGTVLRRDSRHRLLREGVLVTLDAAPEVLAVRVGTGEGRPLLAGESPVERLRAIRQTRGEAYAECHARIDTGSCEPAEAAARIAALSGRRAVVVPLGTRSYRVDIGAGVRREAAAGVGGASSVVVVTDQNVAEAHAAPLVSDMEAAGKRVTTVVLPPGEPEKQIGSVQTIWEAALSGGIDRRAMVVGVGGGVVGDLAGFAAATLLRGIAVGHVPTTLLSMVDSSIGGKTGFDTRHGKNLVGAFHQPSFVLADVEVLATLPEAERTAGLAEVVKSAWIEGEAQVAMLEADAEALRRGEPEATLRAIEMSCRMKARVVTEDEREAGLRAVLNLGHTVGHAIEAARGFGGLRHGEAVALGMVAACRLAHARGQQTAEQGERLIGLLRRLGLPVDLDGYLDDDSRGYLARDKKRDGDDVRFVVPSGPGRVEVVPMALSEVVSRVWGGEGGR